MAFSISSNVTPPPLPIAASVLVAVAVAAGEEGGIERSGEYSWLDDGGGVGGGGGGVRRVDGGRVPGTLTPTPMYSTWTRFSG